MKNSPGKMNIADFSDKTLLIVDDDDPFRNRLGRAMETKGFNVSLAKSVEEGLIFARKSPPGFAVVDLRLLDGNGLDVYKSLKLLLLIIRAKIAAISNIKPLAASNLKNHLKGLEI